MKKLTYFFLLVLITLNTSAQETIKLTVNGQGATKEEATANALRSAIEQSFGVFVSANTQILNDEVVKNEIATIASGNIQEYKELGCITMPNGQQSVSLSATVSIGNLISYAKSKGSSVEFAGATFAMNMKMRKLNTENEVKALYNMLEQFNELAPSVFNWELSVGEPVVDRNNKYRVPMTISALANESSAALYNILINTLKSISLTPLEVEGYKKNGMKYYTLDFDSNTFILRNDPKRFFKHLSFFMECLATSFRIKGKSQNGEIDITPKLSNNAYCFLASRIQSYDGKNYKLSISGGDKYCSDNQTVISKTVYAYLEQDELFTMQGFEISHDNVSRLKFRIIDNIAYIEHMTLYQKYFPRDMIGYEDTGQSDTTLKYVTIKSGLETTPDFSGCKALEEVYLENSVKRISSFSGCSSLIKVMANHVEEIGWYAFSGCKSLERISLPNVYKLVNVFSGCEQLRYIELGDIQYIGEEFQHLDNLNLIQISAKTPPTLSSTCRIPSQCKIFVRKSAVDIYKSHRYWQRYSEQFVPALID